MDLKKAFELESELKVVEAKQDLDRTRPVIIRRKSKSQ
jgi:hypothetical protein